ncbi:hypothetical protein ABB37_08813 [Leptomonas pyrrhocoris]|uniref:Cytochrome c domain-containing protein n=1 Tax=Leptomonas pyrrhocoris TaxID=157538 RepID=A0A0N0VDF3_LEPPY|nr:hypothetical protein ABB37_08813 [Leptomonas pyrrhocoris]KPA75151.1 hypothetical protein ABB37_08813 [Leptomonas pyrrhocoris]|eukprot:XP_015653590.1 hypothetical protein ABB37_08813 [Leptomonas pyrrhocoris]
MRGRRASLRLLSSSSTRRSALYTAAPQQAKEFDPFSCHHAHTPLRVGAVGAALCSPLHTTVRFFASANEAETTVPPIRSTQELHTTLLSFAHAAASTANHLRDAAVSHRSNDDDIITPVQQNANKTHSTGVTHASLEENVDSGLSGTTEAILPPSTSTGTEDRLLQQLLLHRRRRRRHQRAKNAAAGSSEAREYLPSRHASSSLFPHLTPTSSAAGKQVGVVAASSLRGAASWTRAFDLFSEAVQQHHVSPTTQHFNLLLYIAQQHRLWSRMDDVEEFQAHLLASVQQLIAEKRKAERRSGRVCEGNAGGQSSMESASPQRASLTASSSATFSANQIAELQEMESALMPNAQTYELLIAAALARGSWSRALEYCEMRTRSGVAVLTDSCVRQVLQVYALAETTAATTSGGAWFVSPPIEPHPSPPRRLRTDQQGPGLRTAAQPRSTTSTNTTPSSSLTRSPSSASLPEQYWSVALAFFRSSLHRVTSMQTVWAIVSLMHRSGQQHAVLQIVNEDCRELVQAHLLSLASHALMDPKERAALLQMLWAVSNAAREVGDWRVAQQLLRDVVELRRQLVYSYSSSAGKLWGALSPLHCSTSSAGISLPSVTDETNAADETLYANTDDEESRMTSELQLSQYVLQSTLHTLRRVRRYSDMVELYRTSPHRIAGSGGVPAGKAEAEAGEVARVWRTMWTPQAVSFVAQAGLATGDLDLLLGLCGFADGSDDAACTLDLATSAPSTPFDTPADVYDAALRLLQSRILQHHLHPQATTASTAADDEENLQTNSLQRYVALSQRVYAAYRLRALEAVDEETSPYRQYLQRVSKPTTQHQQQHEQKNRSLSGTSSFLSATHAPLVQLLARSLQTGITTAAATYSLLQQALAEFKRIRRPDTLTIALVMDFVRSQTRFTDAPDLSSKQPPPYLTDPEAQSIVLAVQQIFDTVLAEERLDSVQLVVVVNASSSSPYTQPPSPSDNVSLQQLKALSVVTSATVLMSFDILARAQPLVLLRFIPRTVHFGWLPRELAAAQLHAAQRAVVAWTAARQQHTARQMPLSDTSKLPSPNTAASSGAAVAVFVRLYAQCTVAVSAAPSSSSSLSVQQQVLAAAAQVLTELQRMTAGRSTTAAMATFKHTLQDAWKGDAAARHIREASSVVSEAPARQRVARNAELEVAVVASINALVQQIGASTVHRWTMWGDCADLLDRYLSSPLAEHTLSAAEDNAETGSHGWGWAAAPSLETLRVLRTFLRQCDKAEAPFVEYVTMRWVLGCGGDALGDGTADETGSKRVTPAVSKLRDICSQSPRSQGSSHTSVGEPLSKTPIPLSSLQMETMLLLLDAFAWACRRRDKPLARRLYASLAPWIDVLLNLNPPLSNGGTVLSKQLEHLRDAAQSTYMTLLQCLSNGARSDVLRDWPVLQDVLRHLTASASSQQQLTGSSAASSSTAFTRLRSTAVLVDGIAAVVAKLQRTFYFLVVQLALDTHRAVARVHASSEGTRDTPPRFPVEPHGRHAIESAAEAFSSWCTAEFLPGLVFPCLRRCAEGDAAAEGGVALRTFLVVSLHRTAAAVSAVDFVAFVWHTRFRPTRTRKAEEEGDVDPSEASTQVLARYRQRGLQLFTAQLRWADTASAMTRPLRLWLLFAAHAPATTSAAPASITAVAELCRDLTSLEMLYALHEPSFFGETSAAVPSFFHLLLQQVDELTTAMRTRAASTSVVASSSADASSVHSSSTTAALPRLGDGCSPMELLTTPLLHFTPSVLRVLQQAAQQVLSVSLCEGTVDVQAVRSGVRQLTDVREGAASDSFPSSSLVHLPPALLRRCLAWPGQPTTYPVLLRAVEVAAYETLREPAAVVDVLSSMTQLRLAESALAAHAAGGRRADRETGASSAHMFLAFYLQSAALRRASPVNAQVCLAALLACASATTVTNDAACFAPPPPQDVITLLSAFPHVVSLHLFQQWQRRALAAHQESVLRSWMLLLLWGGTQTSAPTGAPTARTPWRSSVQVYSRQAPAPFPLPLRRAALQWLVLTHGTVLPPSVPSFSTSPKEEDAAASGHRLVALFNVASDAFVDLVKRPATPVEAPQAVRQHPLSIPTPFSAHSSSDENSSGQVQEEAEVVSVVRTAVSHCLTCHAVQQLLLQYPAVGTASTSSPQTQHQKDSETLRTPLRPCAVELEALVRVLPAPAQDDARARFSSNAKPPYDNASLTHLLLSAGEEKQQGVKEWAVSLARWIDDRAAQQKDSATSSTSLVPPPPPSLTMPPSSPEMATWKDMYASLHAAAAGLLQHATTSSSPSSSLSQDYNDFYADAEQRMAPLRSMLESFVRAGARLHAAHETAGAADEASACVNALLLFTCVYIPLASSACACPSHTIALLRHELLALLRALYPPQFALDAPPSASLSLYEWVVQQHVRPLVAFPAAAPPPPSSISSSSASTVVVVASLQPWAVGVLILHHLSVLVWVLGAGSSSHAAVFDGIYASARELFQQTSQDLLEMYSLFSVAGSSAALLLRGAVRTWMQAGVLLGDSRTLMWFGQRLTARLVCRQQESDSEAGSSIACVEEAKAAVDWLEVVSVAAVCAAVCNGGAGSGKAEETLMRFLSALPLLRVGDASAPSGVYASLLRLWLENIQRLSSQATVPSLEKQKRKQTMATRSSTLLLLQHRSYATRLVHSQPFSVVFQLPPKRSEQAKDAAGSTSGDNAEVLAECLRGKVADYLAGPSTAYPPLHTSSPLPEPFVKETARGTAPASLPLTSESVRAAMRCIAAATTEDMQTFVHLESTKRNATLHEPTHAHRPSTARNVEKMKRGRTVQEAWHLMERAALHHRQRLHSGDGVSATPSPLVPIVEWAPLFLGGSVAAIPHTIHFIRPAVSEVVILESCRGWAEAVEVLQHSLRTLQHTGATPVQQYMVQLLLQRLRTTSSLSGLTEADRVKDTPACEFGARLDSFVYRVAAAPISSCDAVSDGEDKNLQRLWRQLLGGHEAHGAAALVCRLIDLLLDSYRCHSAPRSSSATTSTLIDQHTLKEALRCSVHDAVVTAALFRLFWAQQYQGVKGAHAFLSALRAAKLARDEPLAVRAIFTYLWVVTPGTLPQRTELWRTQVLSLLGKQNDALSMVTTLTAAKEAQRMTDASYPLSVEAHGTVWKSWTVLCRMGIVPEAVALDVVDVFKALHRLSEVEELMVTTGYTLKKQ